MSPMDWILGVIEAVLWYFFLWYLLDTLRKPERNLWLAAGVLLVLGYLAFVACPWVRETDAWRRLMMGG